MNAIELLKQQHQKVKQALTAVHEHGGSKRQITAIADELVAHMVIEEHIFYPRIRKLMKDMVEESFEEHAVARFELARLLLAEEKDDVKTRAGVLVELLGHHIEEEEDEMFSKVKAGVDASELEELGARMQQAFETAVAKGYAAFVPSRPGASTRRPAVQNGVHAQH